MSFQSLIFEWQVPSIETFSFQFRISHFSFSSIVNLGPKIGGKLTELSSFSPLFISVWWGISHLAMQKETGLLDALRLFVCLVVSSIVRARGISKFEFCDKRAIVREMRPWCVSFEIHALCHDYLWSNQLLVADFYFFRCEKGNERERHFLFNCFW